MLFLKYFIISVQLLFGASPLVLAAMAIRFRSFPMVLAALVLVFAVVAIFPLYKKRESIWIFLLVFVTMAPVDIAAIAGILADPLFDDVDLLGKLLNGSMWFLITISIEELLCSFLARLFWKKQYKPLMMRF